MNLNIKVDDLMKFISTQINYLFPDNYYVDLKSYSDSFKVALDRLEFCFEKSNNSRYNINSIPTYNYLYSDHNVVFYWFLANQIWLDTKNNNICDKLYYLNKVVHGFDCNYKTKLPNIFLIIHGVGTMLGNADYEDYFITYQGVTVGFNNGFYPKIGKGNVLTANSSVIGNSCLGKFVTIGSGTTIINKKINDSMSVYRNDLGVLTEKKMNKLYISKYFDINE